MSYAKSTWVDNDLTKPVSATRMNNLETQYDAAMTDVADQFMVRNSREVSVLSFGAVGNGVADDTAEIQAAINAVFAAGGGTVKVPPGIFQVTVSAEPDVLFNAGATQAANTVCLILRKGVNLIGAGHGVSTIRANDPTKTVIAMVNPVQQTVAGLSVRNTWAPGLQGAGHGIFVFSSATEEVCSGTRWVDLFVSGVGSYGIGLQAGVPENCRIESVTVDTSGADGLDLKARDATTPEPSGNHCSNITIRNHGRRVTGSCGIDVRGVWHLSNITVTDFGGDATLDFVGIRFRTKPPVTDLYNRAAARSSLTNFYIRQTLGSAALTSRGIESGSDYCSVTNGTIEGTMWGVIMSGNANGSASYNNIVNVTALNCTQYGFYALSGVTNTNFVSCASSGAATAGFRDESTSMTMIGCSATEATALSTASSSTPSQVTIGCTFNNELGFTMNSPVAGRVDITARGASTNIDIMLNPKGTGLLRLGTAWSSNADAAVNGFMTIKDTAGTTRKLATIA